MADYNFANGGDSSPALLVCILRQYLIDCINCVYAESKMPPLFRLGSGLLDQSFSRFEGRLF